MIKNVRPVDGSEQLDGEGGTGGRESPSYRENLVSAF